MVLVYLNTIKHFEKREVVCQTKYILNGQEKPAIYSSSSIYDEQQIQLISLQQLLCKTQFESHEDILVFCHERLAWEWKLVLQGDCNGVKNLKQWRKIIEICGKKGYLYPLSVEHHGALCDVMQSELKSYVRGEEKHED